MNKQKKSQDDQSLLIAKINMHIHLSVMSKQMTGSTEKKEKRNKVLKYISCIAVPLFLSCITFDLKF